MTDSKIQPWIKSWSDLFPHFSCNRGATKHGQLPLLQVQQITVQRCTGTQRERERGRERERLGVGGVRWGRSCLSALQLSSIKFEHHKEMLLTISDCSDSGRKQTTENKSGKSCLQWGYSLWSLTYYNHALEAPVQYYPRNTHRHTHTHSYLSLTKCIITL